MHSGPNARISAAENPMDADAETREQGAAQAAAAAEDPVAHVSALLFDADREDREVDLASASLGKDPGDRQLLWIDALNPGERELRDLAQRLALPAAAIDGYLGTETNPVLDNCGKCFWLRVVAVDGKPGYEFAGKVLTMIAAGNVVVTLHRYPVEFLESVRARQSSRGGIGELGAGSFVSALLDWQLGTYFEAVSRFEAGVERLEVDVLSSNPRDCLVELRALRKAASRLRRMLAPHRVVFGALPRADFRPEEDERTDRHFRALDTHYERAMDMVENARDLVVGSFELFSSQTALAANETMKVLTFATVVIGILAVIGGILGMNFEAPLFKTGVVGFTVAVVLMAALAVGSIFFGRWRGWL
ncbi:CorA family divalent cation transporter [Pseudoxanthomonas gei]|uniref:CorA family divalent cation transporter n=1 Tax=Pseudoxanthomonas gei TaxID=1383030 RepID=UPI0013914073